jgi:tetratricopeptide (TPR) repeat protein
LFHLTNILLHALNAGLVWALVARLHRRSDHAGATDTTAAITDTSATLVATVAALLYAIHPLQVEVVAWMSGRMMLLSTLFALASLWTWMKWLDRPRWASALLTVLFVALSAVSKVRIGLPLLFAIAAMAGRRPIGWRFFTLWTPCAAVTACLVAVNVWATTSADLFAEGAEHLEGPRIVRVLQALAWYARTFVWPVGLTSYYPTPPTVYWSDPATRAALAILVLTMAVLAWACRRSRVARLAMLWFLVAIADTLPFFPARNVLAADRYMYLAILGPLWLVGAAGYGAYRRWMAATASRRLAVSGFGLVIVPLLVGISWKVGHTYATPLLKTQRVAEIFSAVPRVWEYVGWAQYTLGNYPAAMECAGKELVHDIRSVQSGGHQLLGMSQLKLGNADEALRLLHRALEIDPASVLGLFRLGMAYDELGRLDEALQHYEAAIAIAPLSNPTIHRLARVYRSVGRNADARAMYEKELANNPYEVNATLGLAELDIALATREAYQAAERRLTTLLDWMPENHPARINLGVVWQALGRTPGAIEAYRMVLAQDRTNVTAAINLAQLYERLGNIGGARAIYETLVGSDLLSVDQALVVDDFFVSEGEFGRSVILWTNLARVYPESTQVAAFAAWAIAQAGDPQHARSKIAGLSEEARHSPQALATLTYADLALGEFETAMNHAEELCAKGEAGADARQRLLASLERFDSEKPDVPWTYALGARLLIASRRFEVAAVFIDLLERYCDQEDCRDYARRLRALLPPNDPPTANDPTGD